MKYKYACVTGASSGIGEATARELAALGVDLLLLARRQDRLEKLKSELQKQVKVDVFPLDISQREQVSAFAQKNSQLLKKIDVLVNNAGLARGRDSFQKGNPKEWDEMIDTNIKGLLYLTREVIPYMIEKDEGHIVNLGSVAGRWTYPSGSVYCATKYAVTAISEGLRLDLQGTRVRVTNIEPGMVETEFSLVRFGNQEKAEAVYQGMTPLSAKDIAETITWCLSRPPHVNIQEVVIFPTDQAGIQQVYRRQAGSDSDTKGC